MLMYLLMINLTGSNTLKVSVVYMTSITVYLHDDK